MAMPPHIAIPLVVGEKEDDVGRSLFSHRGGYDKRDQE
jgi:hypothetical protein